MSQIRDKEWVIINDQGKFYHFWIKDCQDEPQFGDAYWAKAFTAQGCGKVMWRLKEAGYKVERKLVVEVKGIRP